MTATLTDAQAASLRDAAQKVKFDNGSLGPEWHSEKAMRNRVYHPTDAAFIALANPATILALLDEREVWLAAVADPNQGLWRYWNDKAVAMVAERDALRAERDALALANAALTATALYKRAEAAEAEAARLRKALEPFAECEPMDVYENEDEDANGRYVLTVGHFRAARAFLAKEK